MVIPIHIVYTRTYTILIFLRTTKMGRTKKSNSTRPPIFGRLLKLHPSLQWLIYPKFLTFSLCVRALIPSNCCRTDSLHDRYRGNRQLRTFFFVHRDTQTVGRDSSCENLKKEKKRENGQASGPLSRRFREIFFSFAIVHGLVDFPFRQVNQSERRSSSEQTFRPPISF
jgi:hypothetical protein